MELINKIILFKKNDPKYKIIKKRLNEFNEFKRKTNEEWFLELCFCILTANSSAELGIKIQKEIGKGFLSLSLNDIKNKLKELGHRYYNKRAEYIFEARKYAKNIKKIITNIKDPNERREFLVNNIKGIGYKEGSHFLRNVGFKEYAIIDRHILKILYENKYIEEIPKTITKKRYLYIENILKKIGNETNSDLAELDLILWYFKTNKILK